ncbi:hypothetical protein BH18ACT14_BH18ACT14_18990 [soil metagenome]
MLARFLTLLVAALALAPAAAAAPVPTGLHGFLLRATESAGTPNTFARTPSFAWNSVRGARRYELQLSTSKNFTENGIVWESEEIRASLATVPLTLPWVSSPRYSWYARVRAIVGEDVTAWSDKYGFNLRSPLPPASLSTGIVNPRPGLLRWTPVDGATAYEVSFITDPASGAPKKIKSATTAADLREYYSFHNDPSYFDNDVSAVEGEVWWRVRAVREVFGTPMNDIKVVSYGPWSTLFKTVEPPVAATTLALTDSVSRSRAADVVVSDLAGGPSNEPHELAPAFSWSGSRSLAPGLYGDCPGLTVDCPLFHVYVFTDEDCSNRVHVSDLVGSPAYIPRLSGPLGLPADPAKLAAASSVYLADAPEEGASVYDAGGEIVKAAGTEPGIATDPDEPVGPDLVPDRKTGFRDVDWPDGRYYWTAVPAVPYMTPDSTIEYHDVEFAEDMCAAGEVLPFGKTSEPVTERESGVPFVSGMSEDGQLRAATTATPTFFGRVVVAWKPALGARKYEVQWSRRASPWKTAGSAKTPATAALLDLEPGRWFYRVRGLDTTLTTLRYGMTWSDPQKVTIVPRRFRTG